MRCTCVKEHLSTLADNEATPLMKFRLRRHLAHCQSCAAELADLQRIGEQAREWRAVDSPAALRERVMSSLPQPVQLTHNSFQRRRINFGQFMARWRFAGVLGGILLLHWIVVGRLDAQRADLLMLPASNATLVAASQSETESVTNNFAWRSRMVALLLEGNEAHDRANSKGIHDDTQSTIAPAGTPLNYKSG